MSQQWNLDGRYSLFAAVGFCGSLTFSSFLLYKEHTGLNQSVIKELFTNHLKIHFQNLLFNFLTVQKKLYRIPKDRTVIVTNDAIHFLGELA